MRLLVAEADTSLAEFLQTRLQQEHFAVQLASTGDQISKFGEKSLFDLILLDLNLPGVPGPDYLRHLQSRWPEAPVVLLSSASSVEERIKGLDAGADDIIMKPFAWSELAGLASARCCAGATGLRGKFFSMRIWK
jgi:DNA-binding response OmpR family regulator